MFGLGAAVLEAGPLHRRRLLADENVQGTNVIEWVYGRHCGVKNYHFGTL